MGKKKNKNKRHRKSKPHKKNQRFANNIIVSVLIVFFLFVVYKNVPGYNWLFNNLVIGNLKIVWNNPELTIEQKYAIKLGFDYRFIDYVKKNTPENAVILAPPKDTFAGSEFNMKGAWGAKSVIWNTYFLYPRVVITEEECEIYPKVCEQISHVMIVNSWGYDKLGYEVPQKQKIGVYPINVVQEEN